VVIVGRRHPAHLELRVDTERDVELATAGLLHLCLDVVRVKRAATFGRKTASPESTAHQSAVQVQTSASMVSEALL
jgi:hypothetical protein